MARKSRATVIALLCLFTLSIAATDESSNQISLPNSDGVGTEADSDSTAVPLTKLTVRPVNRRFDVRSKRPCRNRFRVHPEMNDQIIPYGNDMILASGENTDFDNPVVHGEGERVQGRLIRLHRHHHFRHHDEDSDSDDDEDDRSERKVRVLKKLGKHYRHHNWEAEKQKKGGFMKRVRKFLDHIF